MSILIDSSPTNSPPVYETTPERAKSDDESTPVRPRVSHRRPRSDYPACQTCRKRKVRCIQSTPGDRCVNCQLFGDECNIPSSKRRLRPKAPTTINPNVRAGTILRRLIGGPRKRGASWMNQQMPPLSGVPTHESTSACSCEVSYDSSQSCWCAEMSMEGDDSFTSSVGSDLEATLMDEAYRQPSKRIQSTPAEPIGLLSLLEAWDEIGTLNIA